MPKNPQVDSFMKKFLIPPTGDSEETIKNKFHYWKNLYEHPEVGIDNPSKSDLADKRRRARQNLRRLADKHPNVAAEIMRELDASSEAA